MRNRLLTSLALPAALATAGLLGNAETAYAGFADSPNTEEPHHGHISDHGHINDYGHITAPLGDSPAVVSGDGRHCPPLGNVTVFDYGQDSSPLGNVTVFDYGINCSPVGNATVFDYGIQCSPLGNATVFDYGINCSPVGNATVFDYGVHCTLPGAGQGLERSSVGDFTVHFDFESAESDLPPR